MFKKKQPWYVVFEGYKPKKPQSIPMSIVMITQSPKDIIEKFRIEDFYCHTYHLGRKEIEVGDKIYLIYRKKKVSDIEWKELARTLKGDKNE